MSAGAASLMWRIWFPEPFRSPFGSVKCAPVCRKNRLTHRGNTAIEKTASEVRSLEAKPIASAL